MSFERLELLPFLFGAFFLFAFMGWKRETRYFEWVRDHWFKKRSGANRLSGFLYYAGFFLLTLALLDPRGAEKKVSGKVGDQKTIILIDASASMLAEDVRPNRFEKAILLAKHFIKKAAGHQLSIVVFSDGQKRIVPFTSDKDLIEARLNTLNDLDLDRGGTGLSLAIQESIQYFINNQKKPFGNILVLTDAEETDGGLNLDVPDGVSVAVVGIGTLKGAPVPMRNSRGVFTGNKKYKGETVITKLDEAYLKKLGEDIEHFKYWVASSYTIPTEEILKFFNRSLKTKLSKSDFRIKPVLANFFLVPGIALLALAFLLKNFKTFTLAALVILCFDAKGVEEEAPRPEKSALVKELEERFAQNRLDEKGKEKLASELLKGGYPEEAGQLYEEILPDTLNENSKSGYFNLGSAAFQSGDIKRGMRVYDRLAEYLKENPSEENKALLEKTKQNVLKAIQAQSQSQKNKDQKGKKENSDQKGQKGESGEKEEGKKKEQGDSQGQGGQQKKEGEAGNPEKDKKKSGQKGEDENKDQDKNNEGKEKSEKRKKPESGDGGEKGEPTKKMPSILKQLMSDDNQLQKKVIDANTVERKTREKKDW